MAMQMSFHKALPASSHPSSSQRNPAHMSLTRLHALGVCLTGVHFDIDTYRRLRLGIVSAIIPPNIVVQSKSPEYSSHIPSTVQFSIVSNSRLASRGCIPATRGTGNRTSNVYAIVPSRHSSCRQLSCLRSSWDISGREMRSCCKQFLAHRIRSSDGCGVTWRTQLSYPMVTSRKKSIVLKSGELVIHAGRSRKPVTSFFNNGLTAPGAGEVQVFITNEVGNISGYEGGPSFWKFKKISPLRYV